MIIKRTNKINLEFSPQNDNLDKGKELRDGLSTVIQIGNTLWVANDESISLERFTLIKDAIHYKFGHHKQFLLDDYLKLPVPIKDSAEFEEIDIEGLDYGNGYLWLVGSHSIKRTNPAFEDGFNEAKKQLVKTSTHGNRYLLARIPLVEVDETVSLKKKSTTNDEKYTAA